MNDDGNIARIWSYIRSPNAMAFVAILSFIFAIYQTYFYEKRPEVTVSIESISRVFDVYQPVGGLKITYAGEDIRAENKALWIMTLSIANTGNEDVRQSDYDPNAPLTLIVSDADLVETPRVSSSNDYLKSNLQAVSTKNEIRFSPVIFEKNDAFDVTMLLLGSDDATPKIDVHGKIAGVKKFNLVASYSDIESKRTLWDRLTLADAWWVNFVRLPLYFFGFIFFVLIGAITASVMLMPFEVLRKRKEGRERKKLIRQYGSKHVVDDEAKYILGIYEEKGSDGLVSLYEALNKLEMRMKVCERFEGKLKDDEFDEVVKSISPIRKAGYIDGLIKSEMVSFIRTKPIYSETLVNNVIEISKYLDIELMRDNSAARSNGSMVKRLVKADYL